MTLLYDPPSGWRYGFPRPYHPMEDETLEDTLIRDGYPADQAEIGARYCRFIGGADELKALRDPDKAAQRAVEGRV